MLEHHAYLCRVDEVIPSSVSEFVKNLAIDEVVYLEIESFGIDDVRSLTEKAFIRPLVGEKQVIVVCLKNITIEAQQALLKILEEPPASVVFVFCVPRSLFILPTVLSRFFEKRIDFDTVKKNTTTFLNFKSLQVADRIAEIGNRTTKKDSAWIDEIKSGLLDMLSNELSHTSQKNLSQLYFIAEHLQTRGASNKLLLEELALTMD